MASVRLVNLTKRFGDVVAVDSVNLEVHDGEFLVLVGPSGCGKTTCLRMIAGLEEATSGEIWIGDRCVNDVSPKDRDIAMVFQNYALYPHMTVYDNMSFALKLRKVPRDEIDRLVREAAQMLGIEELLDRKPGQLSGGQRQRVALGRAIVRQPAAFLMDEPLSNLDAKLRIQTRAELIKLHRELGVTTIYVTHDQVEAMTMGDRIAVMRDGVIHQCATPMELYERPVNRFVVGFIGSPPMNFLDAVLQKRNGDVVVEAADFRVALPPERAASEAVQERIGVPVIFGIRPTDLYDQSLPAPVPSTLENTVSMHVEVVEPMGAESVVYLRAGEETVIASFSGETQAVEGEPMAVVMDMEKAHLFDADTEEAII
ncbi:MAG: sn-glycerol-3-phosphate ABC transporter ATP-binding protein UgpC [Armatimonadetes bacterium]|nr:sn-glycerol-3-phosphate ABC transporter ATP-binding protein UgpC [Armatimonadota bacterium]